LIFWHDVLPRRQRGMGVAMPGMSPSRREFVQVTGLAVVSVMAGTGWTSNAKPLARLQSAPAAPAVGTQATLFPWIGI
jgi:hypothetical protein